MCCRPTFDVYVSSCVPSPTADMSSFNIGTSAGGNDLVSSGLVVAAPAEVPADVNEINFFLSLAGGGTSRLFYQEPVCCCCCVCCCPCCCALCCAMLCILWCAMCYML